MFLLGMLSI